MHVHYGLNGQVVRFKSWSDLKVSAKGALLGVDGISLWENILYCTDIHNIEARNASITSFINGSALELNVELT